MACPAFADVKRAVLIGGVVVDGVVVDGRADRVVGGWMRLLLAGVVAIFGEPGGRDCRIDRFVV